MKLLIVVAVSVFLFCMSPTLIAQDSQSYKISAEEQHTYQKPSGLPFITNFFKDYSLLYDQYLNREHIPHLVAIAGSTAVSVYYDEKLLLESQKLGRQWHISSEDKTKTFFRISSFDIRFPTDLGSSMYFIGDGWTHGSIAFSFLGFGYFGDDYRAWCTSYALFEGLLTTGVASQALKHITGRESPIVRTAPGGIWRIFPNQIDYHKEIPKYDAFPSGHVATAMMTLTVLSENYPEYYLIKPLGYGLLTMLSFQMMNNGVHWFSDYPLALALGYALGKISAANYRSSTKSTSQKSKRHIEPIYKLHPVFAQNNGVGLGLSVRF